MPSAYETHIDSLNPDHYWPLDGSASHTGSASLSISLPAGYLSGAPLTKGASASGLFDGSNALDYGDSVLNLGGPWDKRSYSCWGTWTNPNQDSLLYNEGAGVRNMSLYFGLGGVPAYIVDNDADSGPGQPWSQAIFGPALRPDIPYHLGMVWESNISNGRSYVKAYLNGKLLQEKEIFQNNTVTPGGVLNAHSGNIELGTGQQIIVSGQTFNVSRHVGRIAHCAVWDGVLLSDAQMLQLFELGADTTSCFATFTGVPLGTEIRIFELDALGGNFIQEFDGVESATESTVVLSYDCDVTVPIRIAIVSTDRKNFYTDVLMPRDGRTFPADLLSRPDRNYSNA